MLRIASAFSLGGLVAHAINEDECLQGFLAGGAATKFEMAEAAEKFDAKMP